MESSRRLLAFSHKMGSDMLKHFNKRLQRVLEVTKESLEALGQYETRGCICHAVTDSVTQLVPGCPVHWPHAPEALKKEQHEHH
jgi:hypothetical protein